MCSLGTSKRSKTIQNPWHKPTKAYTTYTIFQVCLVCVLHCSFLLFRLLVKDEAAKRCKAPEKAGRVHRCFPLRRCNGLCDEAAANICGWKPWASHCRSFANRSHSKVGQPSVSLLKTCSTSGIANTPSIRMWMGLVSKMNLKAQKSRVWNGRHLAPLNEHPAQWCQTCQLQGPAWTLWRTCGVQTDKLRSGCFNIATNKNMINHFRVQTKSTKSIQKSTCKSMQICETKTTERSNETKPTSSIESSSNTVYTIPQWVFGAIGGLSKVIPGCCLFQPSDLLLQLPLLLCQELRVQVQQTLLEEGDMKVWTIATNPKSGWTYCLICMYAIVWIVLNNVNEWEYWHNLMQPKLLWT